MEPAGQLNHGASNRSASIRHACATRRAGAADIALRVSLTAALTVALTAALCAGPADAADGARTWIVQLRDTPPSGKAAFARGADRSYTVSTGGGADRDDASTAGNGYVLGAGNAQRQMRVREGERLRVDLPAVQSLQFHVPQRAAPTGSSPSSATPAGRAPASAGSAPSSATAPSGAAGAVPSVSGVVYFEAVAAFAASLHVSGTRVHIDLVPLRVGSVEAPLIGGASRSNAPLAVEGRLGEWIALGDADLPPARSLSPTAEPPSPASVWLRVLPDSDAGENARDAVPADNSRVFGTGQR